MNGAFPIEYRYPEEPPKSISRAVVKARGKPSLPKPTNKIDLRASTAVSGMVRGASAKAKAPAKKKTAPNKGPADEHEGETNRARGHGAFEQQLTLRLFSIRNPQNRKTRSRPRLRKPQAHRRWSRMQERLRALSLRVRSKTLLRFDYSRRMPGD